MVGIPPCDKGEIVGRPVVSCCSAREGRWVLAATILGSSMVFIDGSAVNVALPVLQRSLDAPATAVQWVVEVYLLFLGALILVGGALGDRLGRRRVFKWGVSLFALASLWCGLAANASQLIAARAVQGVGGALLVPGSLAIISASFDEATRGKAIGTWSGFTAITTAAGPVVGGWLVTAFSWRWVFFVNIPLGVVVLAIAATRVPETRDDDSAGDGVDWRGAAANVAGLGSLVYGLITASTRGLTHPLVLGPVAGGLVLLTLFVWIEARASSPMVPLDVFRSRQFAGANVLTFLLYGGLGGSLFFVPFNLVEVQGYTAALAGAAWLPFILTIAGLSRSSGSLVPVVGARRLLGIGPLVTAAGFALAALPGAGGSYWTTFFPAFLAMGLGMSMAVTPLVTVVMGSIASNRAGVASGINNATSRVAGLLVLAMMGVVVQLAFNRALERGLAVVAVRPMVAEQVRAERVHLAAAEPPSTATPEEARVLGHAIDEAFVAAFRLAMLVAAGLAVASAFVAWWTIGTDASPPGRPA